MKISRFFFTACMILPFILFITIICFIAVDMTALKNCTLLQAITVTETKPDDTKFTAYYTKKDNLTHVACYGSNRSFKANRPDRDVFILHGSWEIDLSADETGKTVYITCRKVSDSGSAASDRETSSAIKKVTGITRGYKLVYDIP